MGINYLSVGEMCFVRKLKKEKLLPFVDIYPNQTRYVVQAQFVFADMWKDSFVVFT